MNLTPRYSFRLQLVGLALAASALVACTTPPQAPAPGSKPAPSAPQLQPQARFLRPAAGPIIAKFDGNKSKGIDIAGNAGDPVNASAGGKVVYVGDELRNYGNLIIIDHGDNFLTAYAHNQVVYVSEKDTVRQGQRIAEMGKTGTDRYKVHFEIRKQGVAVDPEPYLQGKLH